MKKNKLFKYFHMDTIIFINLNIFCGILIKIIGLFIKILKKFQLINYII